MQELNRKTRNFMTMNKELHPKTDAAQLLVSRKNGRRGLIGCENRLKDDENGLDRYIKNKIEPLLTAVRTSRTITNQGTVDPKKSRKVTNKEKMSGLKKESMVNLLKIWKTSIRTRHRDGREKVI